MRITEPGIYDNMDMVDYVADPCPEPSINTEVIKQLVNYSPAHCFMSHPRLGGTSDDGGHSADLGSAVHAMAFGGEERIIWAGYDNWRTKEAQALRDNAHANFQIPLLEKEREQVENCTFAVKKAMRIIGGDDWLYEQTLIWRDDYGWHRARPDAIHNEKPIIVDLKTTGVGEPHTWINSVLYKSGYDLQAAHGEAGALALGHGEKQYFFLVAEIEAPYCVSLVGLTEAARNYAEHARAYALTKWRDCITSGQWPGYDFRTVYADPTWAVTNRYERIEAMEGVK